MARAGTVEPSAKSIIEELRRKLAEQEELIGELVSKNREIEELKKKCSRQEARLKEREEEHNKTVVLIQDKRNRLSKSYVNVPVDVNDLIPQSEREVMWKMAIDEADRRARIAEDALKHLASAQAYRS